MSGGSYDYLFIREPEDLMTDTDQLERMADRLYGLDYAHDVATDTQALLDLINYQRAQVQAAVDRLKDVWHAVEWWDSNDWSEDRVKEVLATYRAEEQQ